MFIFDKTFKMNFKKYMILCSLGIAISSCSNNSTDDLESKTLAPEKVSYLRDIKPIIETNCLNCHTNPPTNYAPMSLINFEEVRDATLDRGLIDRISRAQGSEGMMPNGGTKLPQSKIDLIIKWQVQGFQE